MIDGGGCRRRSVRSVGAVHVENLTVRFGDVVALRDVSVRVPARALTAVVGPAGCGKTSLLKALSCELPWGAGSVSIQDVSARLWPEKKREACLFLSPGRSCEGCRFASAQGCSLTAALELLGIEHLVGRPESSLSPRDGVRLDLAQTLAPLLAGACSADTAHLWLDDPLDGIDTLHQHRLLQWLRVTAPERTTTIVTLTDHTLARLYADYAIVLRDAAVVAEGPAGVALAPAHLTRAFGDARPR